MQKMKFILLIGAAAMLLLPGCASRDTLVPESGRAYRMLFAIQAQKRSAMKVAPLTATEARIILDDYEGAGQGRRSRRGTTRSSTTSRPRQTGRLGRVRRID